MGETSQRFSPTESLGAFKPIRQIRSVDSGGRWCEKKDGREKWRRNEGKSIYIISILLFYYCYVGRQGGSAMPRLTSGDDDDDGEVNDVDDDVVGGDYY